MSVQIIRSDYKTVYVLHEMILKRKLIFFQALKKQFDVFALAVYVYVNVYLVCFTEPLAALGYTSAPDTATCVS